MGASDHKQRRTPHKGRQPLSTSKTSYGSQTRQWVGYTPTVNQVVSKRSSYSQSPYISGDRITPNNHEYFKQYGNTPYGSLSSWYAIYPNDLLTYSGVLSNLINYDSLYITPEIKGESELVEINRRSCRSKFLDRMRDSELDLAVDLAEAQKTKQMMGKTVDEVITLARKARRLSLRDWRNLVLARQLKGRDYYRAIRHVPAKYRTAKSFDKILADRWLEWTYGWRPLLSSIFGLCDFDRHKANRVRIQANTKKLRRFRYSKKDSSPGMPVVQYDTERSSYCTIRCDFRVSSTLLNDVSRLTSMNPLAIAWELVPYSFVADWFYNLGGYMRELETAYASGLTFVRGYEVYTFRYLCKMKMSEQRQFFNGTNYSDYHEAKWREYYIHKNRMRLVATPTPFPPRLEVKLGAKRLLSAAALLRQILGRSAS